jgi:restriction system protein
MATPTYDELFNPTLAALHHLGGSGTTREIETKVAVIMKLTERDISAIHRGNITKLNYRLAWARTYLKRYGLLENSEKGVWRLTSQGLETWIVEAAAVNNMMRELTSQTKSEESGKEDDWRQDLLASVRGMTPSGFEFLCQRLLREAGFEKVEVTGRTGDGGIDGKGIMRLGGLLSFHVVFQCKKYAGTVPSKQIRDFRGAMSGRSEKGLFITTGRFTPDAIAESQREGAIPIDLIDGQQLADLMLSLNIGVAKKEVVDKGWFTGFKAEHEKKNSN